jgi:HEAT repeat protein
MTEGHLDLDVWVAESNTIYRRVQSHVVAEWRRQGRLLDADVVCPSGTEAWVPISSAEGLSQDQPVSELSPDGLVPERAVPDPHAAVTPPKPASAMHRTRRRFLTGIGVLVGVAAAGLGIVRFVAWKEDLRPIPPHEPVAQVPAELPRDPDPRVKDKEQLPEAEDVQRLDFSDRLRELIRKKETDSRPPSPAPENDGRNSSRARAARWILRFSKDKRDYLNQLAALNARLFVGLFVEFDEARPGTLLPGTLLEFTADLKKANPDEPVKTLEDVKGLLLMDDSRQFMEELKQALRLTYFPKRMAVVFPMEVEERLARLEKAYRNLDESDIERTEFETRWFEGKIRFYVHSQREVPPHLRRPKPRPIQVLEEPKVSRREGVEQLIANLKDEIPGKRLAAARTLGKIGPAAKDAIPALVHVLNTDEEVGVRIDSADALGRIGPAAVPALIDTLKERKRFVRELSAEALGQIGPAAKDAVPALIVALKDEDSDVRSTSAMALGRIGPAAKKAVPALVVALNDNLFGYRAGSARALGLIGPEAKEAVPALITALMDEDGTVRRASAVALGRIGPVTKTVVPALAITAVRDEDFESRRSAAFALSRIGPAAKVALPLLQKTLDDRDFNVRVAGAVALVKVDEAHRAEAGQKLLSLLDDSRDRRGFSKDEEVLIVNALAALGHQAKPQLSVLRRKLERYPNPQDEVNRAIRAALQAIEAEPAKDRKH